MLERNPWRGAETVPAIPIDHIGIVVPQLDSTITWLTRHGFKVSKPQQLVGADGPVGQASAHCVFANGYLEISAPVAGSGNHLEPLLKHGPGIRILALASSDIAADHARVTACGLAAGTPRAASRTVTLTTGAHMADFVWFPLTEVIPGTITAMVEHRSRHIVFAPELRDHPNGAARLADILFGGSTVSLDRLRSAPIDDAPQALAAPSLPAGIAGFSVTADRSALERQPGFDLRILGDLQ